MRVFRWTSVHDFDQVPGDDDALKTDPGLSSYVSNPSEAGASLATIITAALALVPADKHASSRLYVKATAGLRMLDQGDADAVLADVRQYLNDDDNCPFPLVSAMIISGEAEALFGHLSINFLLGSLLSTQDIPLVFPLDMGGASTQVVIGPSTSIRDGQQIFYSNGTRHEVYARSYIKYGQDQAVVRYQAKLIADAGGAAIVQNPCFNVGINATVTTHTGTVHNLNGTGNSTLCAVLAEGLMHHEYECLMEPCAIGTTYSPPIPDEAPFLAFSGYFYLASGIGLVGWNEIKDLSPLEIKTAGEDFCLRNVSAMGDLKYSTNYCFVSIFVYHLLTSYGFGNNRSIQFSRKLDGADIDWTAGAMLFETQLMPLDLSQACGSPTPTPNPTPSACPDDTPGAKTGLLVFTHFLSASLAAALCFCALGMRSTSTNGSSSATAYRSHEASKVAHPSSVRV